MNIKTKTLKNLFRSILFVSLFLALVFPVALAGHTQGESSPAVQEHSVRQFTAGGHILGFTSGGLYVAAGNHALHVEFIGANPTQPQADMPASASGSTTPLSRVEYSDLWPGIHLTVEATKAGILRSTYQLDAGADASAFRLQYNAPLMVNHDGSLTIPFKTGALNETAPRAWQMIGGKQISVAGF
jgi:hypothetical protein